MASETQTAPPPARPPARPQARSSRHALEPNPFEQSFSSKPDSSLSPEADGPSREKSRRKGQSDETSKDQARDKSRTQQQQSRKDQGSNLKDSADNSTADGKGTSSGASDNQASDPSKETDATPSKRLLPPVAAITSPSTESSANHYPWGGAGIGSLRAGPLSPAMLTGPQAFDPASFRTGFTPDLSNFKTGLTPLGSTGSGYPLPSPGTSAFMAMVNSSGPPITPNTFQALTSNLGAGGDSSAPTSHQRSGHNGQGSGDFDLDFGKQFSRQHGPTAVGPVRSTNGSKSNSGNGDGSESVSPEMIQQQLGGPRDPRPPPQAQQKGSDASQPTQAASGLFLLSQAHHELSKRDEAAAAQAQGAPHISGVLPPPHHMMPRPPHIPANGSGPSRIQGPAPSATANKNGKRKKANANNAAEKNNSTAPPEGSDGGRSNGPGPAKSPPPAGKPNKKSKLLKREESGVSMADDNFGSDDDSNAGGGEGYLNDGGDDDEEKRKNFLERNRQAALKCRQRKKAWLQDLQAKVAFFESENGNLQNTIGALRNEVMYLKSQMMQMQQQMGSKGVTMPPGMPGMSAPDPSMLPPGMHMPPGMHHGHGQHLTHAPQHPGHAGNGPHQQGHGFGHHGLPTGASGNRSFSPTAGPKAQAA